MIDHLRQQRFVYCYLSLAGAWNTGSSRGDTLRIIVHGGIAASASRFDVFADALRDPQVAARVHSENVNYNIKDDTQVAE